MFFKKIDYSSPRLKSAGHLAAKVPGPTATMSREELRRIVAEMLG